MDPGIDMQNILRSVKIARAHWELNVQRMHLMLDEEPEPPDPDAVQELRRIKDRLLWDSIPRQLMPRFKPIDRQLVETANTIGSYRLVRFFDCMEGSVLQSLGPDKQKFAIKVIDKSK